MQICSARFRAALAPAWWATIVFLAVVMTTATARLPADDRDPEGKPETPSAAKPAARFLSPAAERMKRDVTFLAADEREGRAPGTKGIEAAGDYIASVFKSAGLKPAPGGHGFFQPFSIGGSPTLKDQQALEFVGPDGQQLPEKLKQDFNPLTIGASGEVDGVPVVFAGYGITAHDDAHKLSYDDYASVDVKGKAVLIVRHEPQQDDAASPFAGKETTRYSYFEHKVTNAFRHGAAAVLLANDLASLKGESDQLIGYTAAGSEAFSNLPVVMLKRAAVDKLLAAAGEPSLGDFEQQIDGDLKPRSRELKGWRVKATVGISRTTVETKNVIGVLEGAGPLAEETVVVGGHYDHLGRGGLTSGSLAFFSSEIHNGADDNASGTSMVMELARRLGARPDPPPRRVVFMAFSGEERGLLGSQYYVEHPLFPLKSTVMMINCDMVGRLDSKNDLQIVGTGTSAGIDALIDGLGKSSGLAIKKVTGLSDGFGGSDHQSFYAKGVPVLFAFTGLHKDYHRPTDDSNLINYPGMARIADYLELVTLEIAERPDRPVFTRLVQARRQPPRTGSRDPARAGSSTYLGTMPDYAYEGKDGLRLSGVSPGGPAEKGGLKEGDIITRFAAKPVGTIYDFMESLGQHKPGDQVELFVKRDGKEIKLQVTLGSRPHE
jgi:hypothetical protein